MLYPDNIESKIGFDSVRALIMEQCLSPLGKEEIEAMGFSSDFDTIVERIALVDEAMSLYRESGEKLPIGSLADIRGAMGATQAEGTFLELRDVADLRLDLSTLRTLVSFLRKQDAERFPSLAAMAEPVELFPDVEAVFADHFGVILPFHAVKGSVTEALQREVKMRTELTVSGNPVGEVSVYFCGICRAETNSFKSRDFA